MAKTNPKIVAREKRLKRVRKKISGTPERPRLRVFKSSSHIYVQIIDDVAGKTLVATSTLEKSLDLSGTAGKVGQAHQVGMAIARKAKEKGIESVVFDRGGFLYHGRIKAVSDGAREGGLIF
ncbi:MAG: 50S ribosomal protein L18 [Desulfobacteraceae bacterium]|nr:50S ribosomal protein L18 [Desulfobacteraceae bacterium]